jgi:hypothetical protein
MLLRRVGLLRHNSTSFSPRYEMNISSQFGVIYPWKKKKIPQEPPR